MQKYLGKSMSSLMSALGKNKYLLLLSFFSIIFITIIYQESQTYASQVFISLSILTLERI